MNFIQLCQAEKERLIEAIKALIPEEQWHCDMCVRYTRAIKYLMKNGQVTHYGSGYDWQLSVTHIEDLPVESLTELHDKVYWDVTTRPKSK